MTKPGKRLIVCCDGTWNKLDTTCPTNVLKLAQAVTRTASDGVPQIVFYDEGIGVDSNKIVGGVTGLGIDKNIQDAYRFLSLNYDRGDEIYLFGFSRGAYTVRSLAGMIYCSGLLSRRYITKASQAYELYRDRGVKPNDDKAKSFREKYGKDNGDRVPITLLGCFDTVGALGIPLVPALKKFEGQIKTRYKFHDTTLNKDIDNALHAVAIDEIREVFDVTLMKKNPDAPNQKLRQVWFPGEHGCIGGGTPEYRGLSDAVLKWMLDQISDYELKLEFEPEAIEDIKPDYKVPFKNDPGFFKWAGIKLRDVRETIDDLHESAIERFESVDIQYHPKNLEPLLLSNKHLKPIEEKREESIEIPELRLGNQSNLQEPKGKTISNLQQPKRETIMPSKRDTSRDGQKNKIETLLLTNFKPLWNLIQSNEGLSKKVNKTLINNAVLKIPTRPYAFSTMSPYTSWESLNDRSYSGLHLPPTDWKPLTDKNYVGVNLSPTENFEKNLPPIKDLEVLYRKKGGKTKYSAKSSLMFPYFVQWFTDSFLRTDRLDQRRNSSNHHIDLCNVYGLNANITKLLRSHQGGKLKSQILNGEEYPPFYYDENGQPKEEFKGIPHQIVGEHDEKKSDKLPSEKRQKLFAMGIELERVNVQIGYVMLNVLSLREHNRVCDLLAKSYPTWDDERLFQTARNIVMAEFLKIVLEDYINHLTPYHFQFFTDPPAFIDEKWYRNNWMMVEFTLVYRWHSMLPDKLIHDGKEMSMPESMWNNDMIINKGLGAIFEETCSQPAAQLGLFNTAEFLIPTETASIRAGRAAKLRTYNDYRELCKYPRVTDFNQISGDEDVQKELKRLYGHVDNIELYVGLYAEDLRPNSALPPLVGRLIGIDAFSEAFTNPLLAENVFNPETFSPVGWEEIMNTKTLSQVLNRNVPSGKEYKVSFYNEGWKPSK